MSENFLGSFRNGEEMRLEPGQVLFNKGDAGNQMYVVRSGNCRYFTAIACSRP